MCLVVRNCGDTIGISRRSDHKDRLLDNSRNASGVGYKFN